MHSRLKRLAVAPQDGVHQEGIAVGPGAEGAGHRPARHVVHLRLPGVWPADDAPAAVGGAGSQTLQTSRGQVGQPAIAPPGLLARPMPAVMRACGPAMLLDRRAAAAGEHRMDLEGGLVSRAGTLLVEGLTHQDGRRLDQVPVLHPTERA
jgi:hypothetical protein